MRSWLATLVVCLSSLAPVASAQPAEHPAKVELLANVSSMKPGEPFTVGVRFTMQPHWHVYWINPGDSGMPPQVKWKLPEGFTVSELQFPVPKKFEQAGDMVGYGYDDEVLLTATVTPPKDLKQGTTVPISADVNWMVCQDVCLLGDAVLSIDLSVSESAEAAHSELFSAWLARLPQKPEAAGATVNAAIDFPKLNVYVSVMWKDGDPTNVEWYAPPSDQIQFSDVRTTSARKSTAVRAAFKILTKTQVPEETLYSLLAYDGPDGARHGILVPLDFRAGKK
jgi:DsbC/DsbD-like thiol-disulfide interchange protein